jgi:hypothetical protein
MMGLLSGIILTVLMVTLLLLTIDPIGTTERIHPKE